MSDKLTKLQPQVNTLAQPAGNHLLAARGAVQRNDQLRESFAYAREHKITTDELAAVVTPMFSEELDITMEEAAEVARYLADEYEQIGDAVLIVSRDTGRAVARVTDEDFWQPAPVPREDGTMAISTPRLKPEIQGALINWQFSEGRDRNLLAEMLVRGRSTGLVRDAGDKKLQPVTRAGRKQFIEELREELPRLLDETAGGVYAFLNCFQRVEQDPLTDVDVQRSVRTLVVARVMLPLQDPTTTNLHHSLSTTVRRQIANQWVRDVAATVSTLTAGGHMEPLRLVAGDALPGGVVWAADPDVCRAVSGAALPASGVRGAIGLGHPAGWLIIDPASYHCEAREVHDRWEIVAMFEGAVWLDPTKVLTAEVTGIQHRAFVE